MIGQKRLLNIVNGLELPPKSSLLIGDIGCGKHTLISYIANKFNMTTEDISDNINLEKLNEISVNSSPTIYIVDINNLTIKEQNMLLKTVEEPSSSVHIALMADVESVVIDTLRNRCLLFKFDNYSKDELLEYVNTHQISFNEKTKNIAMEMCDTIGQLTTINADTLEATNSLCNVIVSKLSCTSYANTLSIDLKLNYKDNYDKIDVTIFVKTLLKIYTKLCIDDVNYLPYYNIVDKALKSINAKRFNKRYLVDMMLDDLWEVANCE